MRGAVVYWHQDSRLPELVAEPRLRPTGFCCGPSGESTSCGSSLDSRPDVGSFHSAAEAYLAFGLGRSSDPEWAHASGDTVWILTELTLPGDDQGRRTLVEVVDVQRRSVVAAGVLERFKLLGLVGETLGVARRQDGSMRLVQLGVRMRRGSQ